MEFNNLDELKQIFTNGEFDFPAEIFINGIKYKNNENAPEYSVKQMLVDKYKAIWIYSTVFREQSIHVGLNQAIALLWGFNDEYVMRPYDARALPNSRVRLPITENTDNGNSVNINKDKIVGDVVDILITNIPNSPALKGKIDTGADVSSIHAENWDIKNGQVSFICPELSENKITMPVIEKQAIKSSNGDIEYRPVIELNIKINEQQLTGVMFNLNDRGTMTYPILVGQNILETCGFMIDPTINDPDNLGENIIIDWEGLQEDFKDDIIEEIKEK